MNKGVSRRQLLTGFLAGLVGWAARPDTGTAGRQTARRPQGEPPLTGWSSVWTTRGFCQVTTYTYDPACPRGAVTDPAGLTTTSVYYAAGVGDRQEQA